MIRREKMVPLLVAAAALVTLLFLGRSGTLNRLSRGGPSDTEPSPRGRAVGREGMTAPEGMVPSAAPASHKVVYELGVYLQRPDWMTRKQWDSYLAWERRKAARGQDPQGRTRRRLFRLLRRAGRFHVKSILLSDGRYASRPTDGLVAIIDVTARREDAKKAADAAADRTLHSGLKITRAEVFVYPDASDIALYGIKVEGSGPTLVLQDLTDEL